MARDRRRTRMALDALLAVRRRHLRDRQDFVSPYPSDTARELAKAAESAAVASRSAPDGETRVPDEELTWETMLVGAVAQALSERDPERLGAELLQVAAVAMEWAEALDVRGGR